MHGISSLALAPVPGTYPVLAWDGTKFEPTLNPTLNSLTLTGTFTGPPVAANLVFAGPSTAPAAPSAFRALVNADLPTAISVVTVAVSGVLTSTLATGTAPFTVASTTVVTNLNASLLLGSTWASPAAIGTGTPAAGTFTSITLSVTPLAVASGGTASTTAATARAALGVAIDQYGMQIEVPTAKTYYIIYASELAFTINRLTYLTIAGTCTLAIKINGVNVTGLSALSVTTSPATTNATAANSVAIGDIITAVVTSPSSIADLIFNLKVTI